MHIFLTGDVNVGKSSIIELILAQYRNKKIGGFRTICGVNSDVFIIPASASGDYPRTAQNRVGIRSGEGRAQSFPEVFNHVGLSFLSGAEKSDIILMDELGIMETEAHLFTAKVLEILDGRVQVLGAVKPKRTPFLNAVCAHPNTRIIEVTPGNREQVFCNLKGQYESLISYWQ